MLTRAYSLLEIKAIDAERRTITGVATTPSPDRVGDVIEPRGAKFTNPVSLLLHHDARSPVGKAKLLTPTDDGIRFEATLPFIEEPGTLKDRVDEAWESVKHGLIRGVSIGFRVLDDGIELLRSGGVRFTKLEILELSLVSVPANAEALIDTIKSLDAQHLAVSGKEAPAHSRNTPGVAGTPVVRLLPTRQEQAMKSLAEQITSYKSTRDQKFTEREAIMTKASEAGITLDEKEAEQYDALTSEIKALDKHIARLEESQELQKKAAVPAAGGDPMAAHASRGGSPTPVIRVTPNEEKGIGFAKAVLCKAAAFLSQGAHSPLEFAKARYPDNDRVHAYLKAAIPAGMSTPTDGAWAGVLVDTTNLASEFIEYLRPMTIIGKFGQNGIPSLRRVPFNVRILGQTSGGDAYWVGQGAPKPVTKFDFNGQTLGPAKVAAISVISDELARFSTPNAETLVRDALAAAVTERIDVDLIDPAQAAVANVNPASLTNGLTALSPSGVTADAARADVAKLIKAYLDDNNNVANLVLIMPASLALSLSIQLNSLGQREFPDLTMNGGRLLGIPVITSQYAANRSGAGNLLIAVNAADVLLADDGQVTVDASREASIQMLDNPTNSSATATPTTLVSMWQTNSLALRAERFINWGKARSTAVKYMDDVNWGSIGSPA